MYKKNGIAEKYWKTLAIIKDALLINSSLLVNFKQKRYIPQTIYKIDILQSTSNAQLS